ncbi:unnamed protein product [Ascophyllum nodosum]
MLDAIQRRLNFEGSVNPQFQRVDGLGRVGVAGFATGLVFGLHLSIIGCSIAINGLVLSRLLQWSLYVCSVSFFHFSEFFMTALYRPDEVSYKSFVINHSREYTGALLASWVEFWLEAFFLPMLKRRPAIATVGVALVLMGHCFRIGAMWTAGLNFKHEIMLRREPSHELVTHGVYRFFRHPSYFGWFWWSVGTQVLLCNPLCFVAYAAAASMFFRRRIPFEEALLKKFYPDEYPEYVSKTFVGIPFLPRSWSRPSRPHDVAAGVTRHGVAAAPRGGGQERSTPVLARQGSGDERCPLYPGAGDNDGSTDGS